MSAEIDNFNDLINHVKLLPEEAKLDFLAVLACYDDGDISAREAAQYIGRILRENAPVQ